MRSCTQEDSPALAIVLVTRLEDARSEPSSPHIRIEIAWGEWNRLKSGEFDLIPLSRNQTKKKPVVRAALVLPNKEPLTVAQRQANSDKGKGSF